MTRLTDEQRDALLLAIARRLHAGGCSMCHGLRDVRGTMGGREPCPRCTPLREVLQSIEEGKGGFG